MRLFAPRLAYVVGYKTSGYDLRVEPWGSQKYWCTALWSGQDEYEIDDPSWFEATRARPFNDVVHVKIVNSDGKMTLPVMQVDGAYLSPRTDFSNHAWLRTPSGQRRRIADHRVINDGNKSASIGVTWSTGGATNVSLELGVYILDMRTKRYHALPYRGSWTSARVYARTIQRTVRLSDRKRYYVYDVDWIRYESTDLQWPQKFLTAISAVVQSLCICQDGYGEFDTTETVCAQLLDIGEEMFYWVWKYGWDVDFSLFYHGKLPLLKYVQMFRPEYLYNFLLFHESERIFSGLSGPEFGKDLTTYWYNVGLQNAYLDAIKSVPRFSENSISNIIEIAGFIKSLVIDHRIEIPKSLSSIWLSYRYQYQTTKMDVEEAIDFVHRHEELGTLDKWISCYGAHHLEYQGVDVTFRCGFDIRPRDIALMGKIYRALYTYGLGPSFYAVWDMIPYSFIVDWLIPIGNLANVLDVEHYYSDTYYEIENVIFSISYMQTDEYGNNIRAYSRFLSGTPVTLNGFYFFEEDPVSSKVKGFRALDALSLILGRRK